MSKLSNTTCCVVGEVIIRDKAALFGFMTAGTVAAVSGPSTAQHCG